MLVRLCSAGDIGLSYNCSIKCKVMMQGDYKVIIIFFFFNYVRFSPSVANTCLVFTFQCFSLLSFLEDLLIRYFVCYSEVGNTGVLLSMINVSRFSYYWL